MVLTNTGERQLQSMSPNTDVKLCAVLTAHSAISKDEKALIRSRAIPYGIDEADRQLALHNALVIAKIARLDYPHDW